MKFNLKRKSEFSYGDIILRPGENELTKDQAELVSKDSNFQALLKSGEVEKVKAAAAPKKPTKNK